MVHWWLIINHQLKLIICNWITSVNQPRIICYHWWLINWFSQENPKIARQLLAQSSASWNSRFAKWTWRAQRRAGAGWSSGNPWENPWEKDGKNETRNDEIIWNPGENHHFGCTFPDKSWGCHGDMVFFEQEFRSSLMGHILERKLCMDSSCWNFVPC